MNEATALQVQETALAVQEKQLAAIRQIIQQKTPDKEVRTRKGRGGMVFKYTDGAYVIRTLNEALGHNWDFEADNEEVINWNGVPFEVRCRGRLTVRLNGQAVTKVQYGSQIIEFIKERDKDGKVYIVGPVSIGDCFKGAATDAMKKCASLLGVALDLYDSDYKAENYADDEPEVPVDTSDPRPKTLGDLVSAKQLWMIRNMAREQGIEAEQMAQDLLKCKLEEVSRKSASILIDKLKANQGQAAIEDKAIEMESRQRQAQAEKLRPVAKPAENGPSRKAVFNRKHSAEVGARFDAVIARLTRHLIKGDELLRETNCVLHDAGLPQVKTRYEVDDNGAALVCQIFEKWADRLDRELKIDGGN